MAEILRIRGMLAQMRGSEEDAGRFFGDSLALARNQGARLFELRTAATLAKMMRGQGRAAQARELLVPIYAWFSEGINTPDLLDAKAVLDTLH